jgi:hypothetical protein
VLESQMGNAFPRITILMLTESSSAHNYHI